MPQLSREEFEKTITMTGVVVACLVQQDGKYLLVQEAQEKAYGQWNLPAGHVDKDEELEVAAVRETREETGLDVVLDRELAIYHEAPDKTVKHVYAAHVVGGELTPQPGEILQVAWLTYEEVRDLNHQGKLRAAWVWDVVHQVEQQFDWRSKAFYRISAIGLIRNEQGEVLMVNEHGHFTLPGGGWDYGESLHEALRREMQEEIALETDFRERLITTIPFYNPNKEAWQMWAACEIVYDDLKFSVGEHASEVKWFRPDEIDDSTVAGKLTKQVLEAIQ